LPMVMLLALLANRGAWDGRIDRIPSGDIAMGEGMDWIAEDPDVFVVGGTKLSSFGNAQTVVANVGAVESEETAIDSDWEFARQRVPGHTVVAHVEYGAMGSQSTIHYGTVSADG